MRGLPKVWSWVVTLLLVLLGMSRPLFAQTPAKEPADIVAILLPGMHFSQVEEKVALGQEVADHLGKALSRTLTPRVYATAEAMDHDLPRVLLALLEGPYVASRLRGMTPLCVAAGPAKGKEETRLVVMARTGLTSVGELPAKRLAFAQSMKDNQEFLENIVFEGALPLSPERLEPARDAASALSKISLRKADAVLLYDWDAVVGQKAGLRVIYESALLPRPTFVIVDKNVPEEEIGKIREIMSRFSGRVHPQLSAFRLASPERFVVLMGQLGRKVQHLPPLLQLNQEEPPLRLPEPALSKVPGPPLLRYIPTL